MLYELFQIKRRIPQKSEEGGIVSSPLCFAKEVQEDLECVVETFAKVVRVLKDMGLSAMTQAALLTGNISLTLMICRN